MQSSPAAAYDANRNSRNLKRKLNNEDLDGGDFDIAESGDISSVSAGNGLGSYRNTLKNVPNNCLVKFSINFKFISKRPFLVNLRIKNTHTMVKIIDWLYD